MFDPWLRDYSQAGKNKILEFNKLNKFLMNLGSQIYSYSVVNAKIYRHVHVWMNALSIDSHLRHQRTAFQLR